MTEEDGARAEGEGVSRPIRTAGAVLGAILTCGTIVDATDLDRAVGLLLFTEQKLAVMLGIALVLVFLVFPARRQSARLSVPWYDWIAIAVSTVTCAFVAYDYERIFDELHARPLDATVAAVVVVVLVAEGLRRAAGWVLFWFMTFFVAFGLVGHYVPGQFEGRDVDIDRMFIYIALDTNGLVGIPMVVSTTIVVAFILFGNLLEISGGSRFFTEISTALMGRYRGGSSKIAVTASSLFGSISGSAVANVVSTGVITIPLMRKGGYPAHAAGAIEAVASTGGQLMPPMMGAAAFLMAEFLQVAYAEVVLAALIPAILYYVALFIQADLFAARDGIARVDESLIPPRWPVLKAGWPYIVPFVIIILCLFTWHLRPHTSALYAAASLLPVGLLIGYKGERMSWRRILEPLSKTGRDVVQIIMIGAMAGVVIGVLNITGLGFALTQGLVQMAGGNLFLLLGMAAFISIILGMGMPTLGVYLLLATLVAPSMIEVGVPRMAAHLFALYFGMLSMITPPVAIAAFAAATVARSEPMRTAVSAVGFGWSAYIIPFLFVLSPELLMRGSVGAVTLAFVTAVAGVWLVSVGFIGFFTRPLGFAFRGLFVIAGFALLLPASAFPWAVWTDPGGLALAAFLVFREVVGARRTRNVAAAE